VSGRGVRRLAVAALALLAIAALAALFQPFAGDGGDPVRVEIPKEAGVGEIADLLHEQGVVSSAFLFEVRPYDLGVYVITGTVLVVTGLLAAWVPARRAARVDPLVALRAG